MKDFKPILEEFGATIEANPNITDAELLKKFPEFENNVETLTSAYSYYQTRKSNKYKTIEEVDAKFPEFFGEIKDEPIKQETKLGYKTTQPLGKIDQVDITLNPFGVNTTSLIGGQKQPTTFDLASQRARERQYEDPVAMLDAQVAEIDNEYKKLSEEFDKNVLQEKRQEADKFRQEHPFLSAFQTTTRPKGFVDSDFTLSEADRHKQRLLKQIQKTNIETKQILQAPKTGEGNLWDLFKSGGNTLINNAEDIATFGVSGLTEALDMHNIIKRLEDNKAFDNPESVLTKEENLLLNAFSTKIAAEMQRANDTSYWATAGNMLGEAIAFIADMAAFGGLTKGGTKASEKALIKYIANNVSKKLPRKLIANVGKTSINAVRAGVMGAVSPYTYTEQVKAMTNVSPENITIQDRRFKVGDTKTKEFGEVYGGVLYDSALERFTEMGGSFSMLGNMITKNPVAKTLLNSIGGTKAGQLANKVKKIYDNTAGGKLAQGVFWNNIEEPLEELENAVLSREEGSVQEFFKEDNLVPMLMSFTAMSIIPSAMSATDYTLTKKSYKKANDRLMTDLGNIGIGEEDIKAMKYDLLGTNVESLQDKISAYALVMTQDREEQVQIAKDLTLWISNYNALSVADESMEKEKKQAEYDAWRSDFDELKKMRVASLQVNETTNRVQEVTLSNGEKGYIRKGNVVTNEEGTIDKDNTDKEIVVALADGTFKNISTESNNGLSIVSLDSEMSAEEHLAIESETYDMGEVLFENPLNGEYLVIGKKNQDGTYQVEQRDANGNIIKVTNETKRAIFETKKSRINEQVQEDVNDIVNVANNGEEYILDVDGVKHNVVVARNEDGTYLIVDEQGAKQTYAPEVFNGMVNDKILTKKTPEQSSQDNGSNNQPLSVEGQPVAPLSAEDQLKQDIADAEEMESLGDTEYLESNLAEAEKKLAEIANKKPTALGREERLAELKAINEEKAQAEAEVNRWRSAKEGLAQKKAQAQTQQTPIENKQEKNEDQAEFRFVADDVTDFKDIEQALVELNNRYIPRMKRAEANGNIEELLALQAEYALQTQALQAKANELELDKKRTWAEKAQNTLGVEIELIEDPRDIPTEEKDAIKAIRDGKRVKGWYNVDTGKTYLYLPYVNSIGDIKKTILHEKVAHEGIRKIFGGDAFNKLLDKVWDKMSQAEQDKYLKYAYMKKKGEELTDDERNDIEKRRAAADEYMAHEAEKGIEKSSILDTIRNWFREVLRSLGIDLELTDAEIKDIINRSYINLQKGEGVSEEYIRGKLGEYKNEVIERIEENIGDVDEEKGDVRFSVHETLEGEEREETIKDLMSVTGRSRSVVEKWLKAEESLATLILNEDNVGILDYEADESVPSIWKNSDYPQGTVEFSNICKKRLPFTTIYQRLQKEFPNTLFNAETLNTIRSTMKSMGEDVACGLCFVEDRRQLLGEIGQGFIDAIKGKDVELNDMQKRALAKLKESGDKYVPNLFDIITLDGMKELRKEHPNVAQAFIEYNNARGMQSGRLFQAYSAYDRGILKYNQQKVKSINNNGGLRIFSFSDFEAHHLIDLVQVLTDCAAKGIKVQGYTKVPAFAKAVKDTGAKINRSLIPKGVGYVDADYVPKEGEAVSPNVINGKRLLFDTIEGIDINDPDFFDSANSKSVGNIIVAINDEHARLAMADPFVDYIIGFHSGQSKKILKGKGIDTWYNYKNEQLEKVEVIDKKGKLKLKNAPKHGINIYKDILNVAEAEGNPIKTAKQFTERFIEECNRRGYVPRFSRFLNRTKDGKFIYTSGYHKFLIDFKLFDKNGKILPQEAVLPIFDNEFNKQILNDYVKDVKEELPNEEVYEAVKEAIGLGEGTTRLRKVDPLSERFNEKNEDIRFRITPEEAKRRADRMNGIEFNGHNQNFNPSASYDFFDDDTDPRKKPQIHNTLEKGKDYTIDKLIELFDEYSTDKEQKELAKKVFSVAKKLNFKVQFLVDNLGFGIGGRQDYDTLKIARMTTLEQNKDVLAQILLHETIHGVTTYAISAYKNKELKNKKLIEAVEELENVYTAILNREDIKNEYGLVNIKELIAELANPAFRNKLKKINVWEKLKDAIKKIFFFFEKEDVSTDVVLSDALDKFLDNYDVDLWNDYNGAPSTSSEDFGFNFSLVNEVSNENNDIRFRTSSEIDKQYPNWLEGTTTSSGKHSTQVEGTRKTYNKVGTWIEENLGKDVSILDASSGMGYGTEDLRNRGFNIEDVEPYQSEERKQNNPATYSSYGDIDKKYDFIISNAVLNVIPDDWRKNVLHDMAERMNVGGKMFINTRKAGEEKNIKDKIELDSPQEILVKRNGKIASYQRFFTPQELRDWVASELGDGYSVEIANEKNSGTKGLAAVVVTKKDLSDSKVSTSLSERGDAISDNPSSKELQEDSSEHLSHRTLAYPNDATKIKRNTEIAKRLAKKIINQGGLKRTIETENQAISALGKGLGLQRSKSSQSYYGDFYEGEFVVSGTTIHLRISTHPATPIRMGNHTADKKISIVVRKDGEHKESGEHLGYTEYIYEPEEISPKDAANAIVKGVLNLIENGEYIDETGKAHENPYPYVDEEGTIRFRISNENQEIFVSNAEKSVENIKQEKATPQQWLAMIEKNGGLKAGEDKWLGLSDWLKEKANEKVEMQEGETMGEYAKRVAKAKTITKQEILDFIAENKIQIEEVHYGDVEDESQFKELQQEFKDLYYEFDHNGERAWEEMVERHGEDFSIAFSYYGDTLEANTDYGNDAVEYFLNTRGINETRRKYTTDGLTNKQEIALVVPTIESWNKNDEVHFGDAGDGRAVAWVRFGETTDREGNRVLVIDEIQSKRHQEGREKGYSKNEANKAFEVFRENLMEKYNLQSNQIYKALNSEEKEEYDKLLTAANEEFRTSSDVPSAPFEKNWHELAMKRMLRYAAENGFDKVAWTTGEQQAERYNMRKLFNDIEREDNPNIEGKRFVLSGANTETFQVNDNGIVTDSTIEEAKGKPLAEVVGKDMSVKMMSLENGDLLEGEDLKIGGDGMKGFYDKMLPSFMNKYVKKWGTKVGEVTMPQLEEGYQTMHSVDVTPEMKESVMEGQTMFKIDRDWDFNSGYTQRDNGDRISVRASEAEADGTFTEGTFRKQYGVSKKAFELLRKLGVIKKTEWHHTGANFKESDYFSWADSYRNGGHTSYEDAITEEGSLGDIYKANKKQIDNLIKEFENAEWQYKLPKTLDYVPSIEGYMWDNVILNDEEREKADKLHEEISRGGSAIGSSFDRYQMHSDVDEKMKRKAIERSKEELQERYNERYGSIIESNKLKEDYNNTIDELNAKTDGKESILNQIADIFGVDAKSSITYNSQSEQKRIAREQRIEEAKEMKSAHEKQEAEMRKALDKWVADQKKKGGIKDVERIKESQKPPYFITTKEEMNGKYGWFEASWRYNLPVYVSGMEFSSKRLLDSYRNRLNNIGETIRNNDNEYRAFVNQEQENNTLFSYTEGDEVTREKDETLHDIIKRIAIERQYMKQEELSKEMDSLAKKEMSNIAKFQKDWLDAFRDIERFQSWIVDNGGEVGVAQDMYNDIFRAKGRITTQTNRFRNIQIKRMAQVVGAIMRSEGIKAFDLTWQNLEDKGKVIEGKKIAPRELVGLYAQARDMVEAMELGLKDRGIDGFTKNVGMTPQEFVTLFEGNVEADLIKELWASINDATNFALKYQLEGGLIDQATYDSYQNRKYYVPERGWAERTLNPDKEGYVNGSTTKGAEPYNAALKKARGRVSLADDPFAFIQSIGESAIISTEKNKSKQKMLELVLANEELGLKTGGFYVRKVWLINTINEHDGTITTTITYKKPTAEQFKKDEEIKATIREKQKEKFARIQHLKKLQNQKPTTTIEEAIAIAQENIKSLDAEIEALNKQILIAGSVDDSRISNRTKNEIEQHGVLVMKDGQQYVIEFKNEQLANAINNNFDKAYSSWQNTIGRAAVSAKNYITASITQYNPAFAAVNFIRDFGVGVVGNSIEHGALFTAKFMKNIAVSQRAVVNYVFNEKFRDKESFVNSDMGRYLEEFFEEGAETGFSFLQELNVLRKDFDAMTKDENWLKKGGKGVLSTLSALTEISELSIRFAQYVTARQLGKSQEEASTMAKEVTTNFDRKGLRSKNLNALFGFFNASVQGTYRWLKPLFVTGGKRVYAGFSAWAGVFGAMGFLATMLQPNDPDDERYLSEWERMTNLVFGKAKIPLPHFFRMFNAIGVQMALVSQGKKTLADALISTTDFMFGEIIPQLELPIAYDDAKGEMEFDWQRTLASIIPTIANPSAEVILNRNFTGNPIKRETPFNDDVMNVHKGSGRTSDVYVNIANKLNELTGGNLEYDTKRDAGWIDINPSSLEHLLRGYSPALDMVSVVGNSVYKSLNDEKVYNNELPFLRKVSSSYRPDRVYSNEYWALKEKVESIKKFSKDHLEKEDETYIDLHSRLEQINKQILKNSTKKPEKDKNYQPYEIKELMKLNQELMEIDKELHRNNN